jgi:hypothetical protein
VQIFSAITHGFSSRCREAASFNICQIHELGEEGGRHFMAMEYL